MKRYTFFTDDYPVVTGDHCWEDQNEDYCGPAIERLAEYEATGLMPAEVAALQYQLRHAMGIQRQIPVSERVPTEADVKHCKEMVLAYSTLYKSWQREHFTFVANHPEWYTHWMPLPEPPKEVE